MIHSLLLKRWAADVHQTIQLHGVRTLQAQPRTRRSDRHPSVPIERPADYARDSGQRLTRNGGEAGCCPCVRESEERELD